jgi:hypothetical protein
MPDKGEPAEPLVRVLLISIGLVAIGATMSLRGASALIAAAIGAVVVASAFLGLPTMILSSSRSRRAAGPRYEAFYAVAAPLIVTLVSAWVAYDNVSGLYFVSAFVGPRWTDVARPAIYVVVALMNLGVLVSNVVSLRRRPSEPHS